MKDLISALNSFVHKLFCYDKWNIGYVSQSPENLILTKQLNGKINWLSEDTADYAADPFTANINGRVHLYYEELNFWKGRGEIMMTDDMHFKNKKKVNGIMKDDIHLSYPYMFTDSDQLYCIPETASAKQVALYQIDMNNPYKFEKIRVLLEGQSFVDSSIIRYNNKYWLFTSVSGQHGVLYLFYADKLDSPFKAHKQNPIKVASNVSRSAGRLFIVGQKLYMPSQNPKKCYGGSVMINEITTITETDFQYHTAFELLPQAPYDEGLHTINFEDGLLVVDGKRKVFSAMGPFKKVFRKLKNLNKPN
ncbi:glucosamine inositolphosphorylceramide transferase family protein [Mucilaginibacter sp.]|uniref:glucosamine inositolphosphorylceramide transferase family protein n=1 Tax=Mucilaginibacter sp. TaxID=1882438 RepID=UPI002ED373B6